MLHSFIQRGVTARPLLGGRHLLSTTSADANSQGSGPMLLGGAVFAGGGAYYMYSNREEAVQPVDAKPALVRELEEGARPVLAQDDRQSQTIDELQGLLAAAVSAWAPLLLCYCVLCRT